MAGTMQPYLEFSEDSGSGHKFDEAQVDGSTLTERYGCIVPDARWPNRGGDGITREH